MFAQADWIWNEWLRPGDPARVVYTRFNHEEFVEDKSARQAVLFRLAHLLYTFHTYSALDASLIAQLGYPLLAKNIPIDGRPLDAATRHGNFGELLAVEYARRLGFDVPVPRLQLNPNPDQSMKGDDVLAFHFASSQDERDEILVGEAKFRDEFETRTVEEACNSLSKESRPYPVSTDFVTAILSLRGDFEKAARVRQARQKLVGKSGQTIRRHLLFLVTVGRPRDPFRSIEDTVPKVPPNLTTVNVVLQEDFVSWLSSVYDLEMWQHDNT